MTESSRLFSQGLAVGGSQQTVMSHVFQILSRNNSHVHVHSNTSLPERLVDSCASVWLVSEWPRVQCALVVLAFHAGSLSAWHALQGCSIHWADFLTTGFWSALPVKQQVTEEDSASAAESISFWSRCVTRFNLDKCFRYRHYHILGGGSAHSLCVFCRVQHESCSCGTTVAFQFQSHWLRVTQMCLV
eukprot:105050-Amphidinium_carterae.1